MSVYMYIKRASARMTGCHFFNAESSPPYVTRLFLAVEWCGIITIRTNWPMEFYVSVLLGVPSMFIFPSLSLSFRFLFLYVKRRRKKQNKNEWQKIHYLDERLKTGRSSLQASVFVHRVNIYPFLLGSFHVRLIYNLYRLSHSIYLSLFT